MIAATPNSDAWMRDPPGIDSQGDDQHNLEDLISLDCLDGGTDARLLAFFAAHPRT